MRNKTVLVLALLLVGTLCLAQVPTPPIHPIQQYWGDLYGKGPVQMSWDHLHDWQRVARAQPDECFFAIGDPRNLASFAANYPGDLPTGPLPCKFNGAFGTQPKVNQAYVWGMTKWQTDLWFGTIANTLCLAMEGLSPTGMQPLQMNSMVCESNKGTIGDARPPRIFIFDTTTNGLIEMTGQIKAAGPEHFARLQQTIGLRSAGTFGDVVILAGLAGNVTGDGGVAMFAFNGRTRKFIGSIVFNGAELAPYTGVPTLPSDATKVAKFVNVRQWIMANNYLYVGLAYNTGLGGLGGTTSGGVFRFAGTTTQPFKLIQVGTVGGDPAYLAYHKDRMVVSTWGGAANTFGQTLYVGPKMTVKGFNPLPASTAEWKQVWTLSKYEVEPSAASGGGAIASFDGYLYFTTMTPPGAQMAQFAGMYPGAKTDTTSALVNFLGSYRPTEMFRASDFDNPNGPKFEVLYGNTLLPQFQTPKGTQCPIGNTAAIMAIQNTCDWKLIPNRLGQDPIKGLAGYNNFFNSYTWWAQVYDPTHEMFIGTFDWTFLLAEMIFDQPGIPQSVIDASRQFEGADLFRFHSANDPAIPVALDGLGNYANYGIRTMQIMDLDIYMGTANPFNLLTDPNSKHFDGALGGWELIRLSPTKEWYEANVQR